MNILRVRVRQCASVCVCVLAGWVLAEQDSLEPARDGLNVLITDTGVHSA